MDLKLSFNEDAHNYDTYRPDCGIQVFEDIRSFADLHAGTIALEVGCGTGQATEPFLKAGCEVTAIEPGDNLAEYTKKKFSSYDRLHLLQFPFEAYASKENTYDILYSATAFHWIPPEIGYPKAFDLIKHGGTLALFWNRPFVGRKEDALHQKLQEIYELYMPRPGSNKPVENDPNRYQKIQETIAAYGFMDVQLKLHHNTRTFSASHYIKLLNTYSDHRTLPQEDRLPFYEAVEAAIREAGNKLTIYDTIDLHLARKP